MKKEIRIFVEIFSLKPAIESGRKHSEKNPSENERQDDLSIPKMFALDRKCTNIHDQIQ